MEENCVKMLGNIESFRFLIFLRARGFWNLYGGPQAQHDYGMVTGYVVIDNTVPTA